MFGARSDLAERLLRAEAQGFDIDRVLYHGTRADFPAFHQAEHAAHGRGVYFASDPERASWAASWNGDLGAEGANVIPVFVRRGKARSTKLRDYRVEDPADVRSIFAQFDMARALESDLLA